MFALKDEHDWHRVGSPGGHLFQDLGVVLAPGRDLNMAPCRFCTLGGRSGVVSSAIGLV